MLLGVVVATRRGLSRQLRWTGGVIAIGGLILAVVARSWFGGSLTHRLMADMRRQDYVMGFGLGQYLKQTQPGRRVVILSDLGASAAHKAMREGLEDGLEGVLRIVGERALDFSPAGDLPTAALVFSEELMRDLAATGADVVVSFAGLPVRLQDSAHVDEQATQTLWASRDYQRLQWALTIPALSWPWPASAFSRGRVLVAIRPKEQAPPPEGGYPSHLAIKGSPTELFQAWFELVTSDEDL